MPPLPLAAFEDELARVLRGLDVASLRAAYGRQNEFLFLPSCLPPALVEALLADVERVRPRIHRSYIPRHKKGGSVSAHVLGAEAPAIVRLYRSPAFLDFLRRLTGAPLGLCPPADPHAFALYFYTEPGDHIGFHYDTSYYRGDRYTVLVGLIARASSRLVCDPFRSVPGHPPAEVAVVTEPGSLVLFNGNKVWHAVTPLGEGEERVSLTLEYVTDTRMTPVKRFVSNMKDAIAYFGFRAVFGRGQGVAGGAGRAPGRSE